MKHIFVAIVCLLGSMSLQSCLHDDKEFFDESAANRIESTIENTQKILELHLPHEVCQWQGDCGW